jgi:hypothetical protein
MILVLIAAPYIALIWLLLRPSQQRRRYRRRRFPAHQFDTTYLLIR